MHVLVATDETQGTRDDDYSSTVEGELVRTPVVVCDNPKCGCDWGWAGLASSKATTTCRVADLDIGLNDLVETFEQALSREGWLAGFADRELVHELVTENLVVAAFFSVGTVLGRNGSKIFLRSGSFASD